MKPSHPLVLPPGPQAGTGQAAHTLPCSNGRLHPSEREVCGDASAARPGRHVLAAPPEAMCLWWLSTFRNCKGPSTHVLLLWAPVNRAWIDLAAPWRVPDEAVISRSVQIHGPRRQKRRCVPWDMPLTHNGTDTRTSICDYSVSLWRTGHACGTGFLRRAGLSPPVCAMGVTVPPLHASEGCQDD